MDKPMRSREEIECELKYLDKRYEVAKKRFKIFEMIKVERVRYVLRWVLNNE